MAQDSQQQQDVVPDLLLRWEELHEQGQDVPAEELCRDCPELVPELAQRIDALKIMGWVKEPLEDAGLTIDAPIRNRNELAAAEAHRSRILAGRYRLDRRLGEGGFGEVWKGYDLELQRVVAVKLSKASRLSSPERATSFLVEARKAARLKHPGIVPIHDVGQEGGVYFIVAHLIDGLNLAEKMKQGRFSFPESARLVAAVAEALQHSHRHGLVHRDIKPGNILIDRSGQPHVTDFGSALKEEDVGKEAAFTGTPAYMSPEQARGEGHRVDGRSDIFSLGVVFYELLTGRRPYSGQTPLELSKQVTSIEARPPRQWDETIPKELERICLKALCQRPSERYTIAKDFADDLSCYLQQAERGMVPCDASPSTAAPGAPARVIPKGLRSFDANDADFFLELLPGPRDQDGLAESIRFWKTRIEETDPDNTFSVGLIYGPSGCGKSSLVKAGLLPRLAERIGP